MRPRKLPLTPKSVHENLFGTYPQVLRRGAFMCEASISARNPRGRRDATHQSIR